MKSRKLLRVMQSLMLFTTLAGSVGQPITTFAETEQAKAKTEQMVKELEESTESTEVGNEPTEETSSSESTTKISEAPKEKQAKEPTETTEESVTETTDQASEPENPTVTENEPVSEEKEKELVPQPALTQEELDQKINEIFVNNGYTVAEDGNLRSTTGENYRTDLMSVLQQVDALKAQNKIQARANLTNTRAIDTLAANQTIYVDANYGNSAYGWTNGDGSSELGFYAKRDGNGGMLWCVEPNVPLGWGANTGFTTKSVSAKKYIQASLIAYWGYEKQPSVKNAFYVEKMIQGIISGKGYATGIHGGNVSQTEFNTFRTTVMKKVNAFYKAPSFANSKVSLKVGESITLTDTNKVLDYYDVFPNLNTTGLTLTKSGNKLTIKANSKAATSVNLKYIYQVDTTYQGATILFQHPYLQDVIKARVNDPAWFVFDLDIEKNGNVQIKKVDEDGKALKGAQFEVKYGTTTVTKTTNANGIINLNNLATGTKVTVTEIKAPNGYVISKTPQTITVEANKTGVLTFKNTAQEGTITINKKALLGNKTMINKNYSLAGNEFSIYAGKTATGTPVQKVITPANGKVKSKNLPLGTYTVKETKASNGFILNTQTYTVTIKYGGQEVAVTNANVAITNNEQLGKVTLKKTDAETGNKPQGQATFEGAEFELTRLSDNKVLGTYTTDKNGSLSVDKLWIDDYQFVETKAPTGYILDKTPVKFSIKYAGQSESVAVAATAEKKNTVMKGDFDLIKTGNYNWLDNPWNWITGKDNTDQKPVLEGAEFTTYKAFGTEEEQATPIESKTTDKQGYVGYKNYPYGTYRVSETKTPFGYTTVKDFYVTIDSDGQHFHYVVENKVKEARIKFVKVDAETGKEIVRSKAGFEIYSETTGKQLIMQDYNGKDISVFFTDENGVLQIPTQFAFGDYKAVEVQAPEGYVLAEKPTYFTVTGNEPDGLVVVEIANDNQKGAIDLTKTVETPKAFVEKDSEYGKYSEIEFSQQGGEGFEFKIRATEDVITGDNTVRLKAGEFVQENGQDLVLVTGKDGNIVSDAALYIGKYELVETKAPAGVVMLKEPVPFEIEYAGQLVSVTSTSLTVENNLQTIDVIGHKQQETVTGWENGQAVIELEDAKNGQVFGLYNGNDLSLGESTLAAHTALGYAVVKDGQVSFKDMKLPNVEMNLYLKEVNAGKDHVLDTNMYEFTYTPANNDDKHTINVWADSFAENKQAMTRIARNPIVNKLARASVKLIKTDKLDGKPLENVAFDLVRIDGTGKDAKETIISKHATDKNGEILVENLPTGNYKFVETRPLDWYENTKADMSFTVSPETDGQVIEVNVENQRKPLEINTLFATTLNGDKQANPLIDNLLTDKVWVLGMKQGHTYYGMTFYVNRDTKEVVDSVPFEISTDKDGEFIFNTEVMIPKDKMQDASRLTATHIIYEDKEKTKEIGRHDDLENDDQTVTFKTPKVSIRTKAQDGKGFTHGDVLSMYDDTEIKHEDMLDGTDAAFKVDLVAVEPNGKETVEWESSIIDYKVSDDVFTKRVFTDKKVDTGKYTPGTWFYFRETHYSVQNEKDGKKTYIEDAKHNFDGKDKNQSIKPYVSKYLPKTGEEVRGYLVLLGSILVMSVFAGYIILRKRAEGKE